MAAEHSAAVAAAAASDTLPAPAIVAETEQARRVRLYSEFRTALVVPTGCEVVTDRIHDVVRDADILCELRSWQRRDERLYSSRMSDVVREANRWIAETVAAWDRETGERVRRGG